MAWPVSLLIGAGFVGSVESWKLGYWNSPCPYAAPTKTLGFATGEVVSSHCLTPINAVTPSGALQFVGMVALAAGLWWAGWFLHTRHSRKLASRPSALPASSLFLALWFLSATVLSTAWAATNHTFM